MVDFLLVVLIISSQLDCNTVAMLRLCHADKSLDSDISRIVQGYYVHHAWDQLNTEQVVTEMSFHSCWQANSCLASSLQLSPWSIQECLTCNWHSSCTPGTVSIRAAARLHTALSQLHAQWSLMLHLQHTGMLPIKIGTLTSRCSNLLLEVHSVHLFFCSYLHLLSHILWSPALMLLVITGDAVSCFMSLNSTRWKSQFLL
jgi:hypothetical protein